MRKQGASLSRQAVFIPERMNTKVELTATLVECALKTSVPKAPWSAAA